MAFGFYRSERLMVQHFRPPIALPLKIAHKMGDFGQFANHWFTMSLLRHIGIYCACTHTYIHVMQLSKLLPTGCQRKDTDRMWSCYAVLH